MSIKLEPIYQTQSYADCNNYSQPNYEPEAIAYETEQNYLEDREEDELHQTLYARNNRHSVRPRTNLNSQTRSQQRLFTQQQQHHYQPIQQNIPKQIQHSSNSNWRNQKFTTPQRHNKNITKIGKNPFDKHGIQTRCAVCQSINHWAQNCPDNPNSEHNTYITNKVVLHQTDYKNPQ